METNNGPRRQDASALRAADAGYGDRAYAAEAAASTMRREASPAASAHAASRTRVCFIGMSNLAVLAPHLDRGGAAGEPVQQTLLAVAMARRGYNVSMVTADHGQPDGASWQGVQTFKAFSPSAGLPLLRFVHPRWTGLWAALRRANADVYYVSCAGAIVGQVALFCRVHKKRFLYRVASDADCAPDTLLIKRWYFRDRRMYEFGLRRAAGVLAQSVRQQTLLLRNFGVHSVIAGLIVETSPTAAAFADRDIDALWVSNIRKLKRPDVLLDVADQLPQVGVHMAGGTVPGELPFFDEVRAQASTRPNVTFHGPVPYRDVSALYRRARVFINTSDIEGFPNTYLQAWASGAPVVAFFDPDGLIEREGLGVAVRTHQEMQEAVRMLLHDERAWNAASARCLAFIERHYGEDAVLAPYLRMIDPQRAR